MLTVEPSEGDAPDAPDAQAAAAMDVDRHLPSPAPEGWRVEEPRGADDVIRIIETAAGKIVVLLSRGEDSDMVNLAVGMFPPADAPYVTDERARSVLRAFRRRGTFVENNHSPLARAPGMRVFVAPTHR